MTGDPFQDARRADDRQRDMRGSDVGIVVAVSSDGHMVAYREVTDVGDRKVDGVPTQASVMVPKQGDFCLPEVGDLVLVTQFRNRTPMVVGTYYSSAEQIPDAAEDDRIVSASGGGVRLDGAYVGTPQRSSDPTDPPDGAIWYREDNDEYRGVENGTVVTFDTTQA